MAYNNNGFEKFLWTFTMCILTMPSCRQSASYSLLKHVPGVCITCCLFCLHIRLDFLKTHESRFSFFKANKIHISTMFASSPHKMHTTFVPFHYFQHVTLDSTAGTWPKHVNVTLSGHLFSHLGFPGCP